MTRTPARRSMTIRPLWPFMFCTLGFLLPLNAAEKPEADPTEAATATTAPSEIEQLKRMMLDQQRQIDELRRALAGQKTTDPAPAQAVVDASAPLAAYPSTG